MKFDPAQFTPTRWSTAEDKAKFAETLITFLEQGCPKSKFTTSFYARLSNVLGHIAHYDRDGFYGEWFDTPADRLRFVAHTLDYQPVGDPAWSFSDVERVVQVVVREEGYLERYEQEARGAQEVEERAELARLVMKYGVGVLGDTHA